jgi:TRAP transporter TAXI family solute receptor
MTIRTASKLAGLAFAIAAITATAGVAQDKFINILTGGTSGVYYPLGVALSEIYAEGIPGVRTQVQSTKASVENLNLLQKERGELAFALGDSVKLAWDGNADAGYAEPLTELRAIAAIYPNYVQIVASAESGIKTVADLKGKRVSVGAPKSGTELNARAILEASGLSYDDLGQIEYLPFSESVELMKNRQIDATLQSSGLGVASIKDLAASLPITVVSVLSTDVDKIGAPYVPSVIPANTYSGQAEDATTAAIGNVLVTRAGVDDETAYQMTKLLFENLDTMVAAHAAAGGITLKGALVGLSIPLHPGAERYYKEMGLL